MDINRYKGCYIQGCDEAEAEINHGSQNSKGA